jgi:Holliday junction resolvasome RuvABC endonuclease subunit
MAILALDLGTHAGFALSLDMGSPPSAYGRWNLSVGKFEGAGMRGLKFRRYLEALNKRVGLKEIYYEGVRAHKGTDAAHVYGGLMGVLTAFCEESGVPYAARSVQAIKKFITTKGNASKEEVIEAVQLLGYEITEKDDDVADAIALLMLVQSEHGKLDPLAEAKSACAH